MSTAERLFQNAMQALNGRNLPEAARLFKQFLQSNPSHFGALNLITVVFTAMGRYADAEPYIARAVTVDDTSDASFYNYGVVLRALGKRQEALAQFERALRLNPRHVKALNNRGVTFNELGEPHRALAEFDKALALDPNSIEALYNKGNALGESGRNEDALAAYGKALAIQPDFPEGHNNRGRALQQLGRLEEAVAAFDRAVALRPLHVEALFNRGVALAGLKRSAEALASYDRAIAAKPDHAEAHVSRGNVLMELRRPPEAVVSYERAIALKQDFAEAHNNRGNALKELKRLEDAIASYDAAIAIRPDFAEAFTNRGNALRDLKRLEEASASYDAAIALNPDLDFLLGEAFHTRMHACDWRDYDHDLARLEARVAANDRAASPFIALSSFDSCELQLAAAKTWVEAKHADIIPAPLPRADATARKIRIGYFSSDLRTHPMSFLMQGVFRAHDRQRFETVALSFDNPPGDALNAELRASFDAFLDVAKLSDQEVANLSRERSIDIAIDLAGFTAGRRTGVFARRAAPIQVSFLGFPGTMAAPFIDYILADATVVDAPARRFFAEKIVALPDTYYPTSYGGGFFATEKRFSRSDLGLPEEAFVFCCFNNNYKITPSVFDVWMRILRRVEGAVLWLFEDNPIAAANLRAEAKARGVDERRLVFAQRMPVAEHLQRVKSADLFLDTYPYNAHTTATDALWMDVPVVTRIGTTFPARVAASVLQAIGTPELITTSVEDYEALAIDLASDTERLAALKRKLAGNRATAPLFDIARYTKTLEAAYAAMQARRIQGLATKDIAVRP